MSTTVNGMDSPGLTDIHAHPAMNAFLFDRDLRRHYMSGKAFNPLASLSDFAMLEKGGVRVLWSAAHVPEKAFFRCTPLRWITHLTGGGRKLLKLSPWECVTEMMDEMERQVARAPRFAMARTNAELDAVVASGRTAIVHTVEGGHVLEGQLSRVDELARRGVASLTLAHLFPNDVAGHIDGIPTEQHNLLICKLDPQVDPSRGLTPFGRDVVERMVALKMMPDLTHCTAAARAEVLSIVARRVPVLATHTGMQSVNGVDYNLTAGEVREIAATGGVVGVIFMPYWLRKDHPKKGLEAIWETMQAIRDASGTWETVAIGTDFDGFTDPPDDVDNASKLPKVADMLRQKLSPADAEAVIGGNARRVLRAAWR